MKIPRLRRRKPAPPDYLYVDASRLHEYLGMISSTTTHVKASSLALTISLSEVSVERGQTPQARAKSKHEMVTELIRYLDRHGHLTRQRPCAPRSSDDDLAPTLFVLETCDAVPVIIPAADEITGTDAAIWVSEWPLDRREGALRRPGLLCMIQDASRDDRQHRPSFSSYTWLMPLLHQLHLQPSRTALAMRYLASQDGDYDFDIMAPYAQVHPDSAIFRPQPLRWLEAQGCRLGQPRRVCSLYRIRAVAEDEIGMKNRQADFTVSTFAYAIAIWATQ
jgi:hypothetical protein